MVNENRIRIMSALAAYEKHHKEELNSVRGWFRGDYIGTHMMKNSCRLTLAYLVGLMFYIICSFEEVMEKLNAMDVLDLGKGILGMYLACLAGYLGLTYLVYSVRYYQAEKRRRVYLRLLEQLDKQYQRERPDSGRRRQRERTGRRRT